MLHLSLDLGKDLAFLEAKMLASVPNIRKAVDRALRKVSRWLEHQTKREIGQTLKLPQRLLSVRFYHQFYINNGERAVGVWFGLDPVAVRAIGNDRRNKKGLKIGQHQFNGAFWATMKSGHENVFVRGGKSKTRKIKRRDGQWTELPIKKVVLSIDGKSSEVFERYYKRAEARFAVILRQELNFILNVEGK